MYLEKADIEDVLSITGVSAHASCVGDSLHGEPSEVQDIKQFLSSKGIETYGDGGCIILEDKKHLRFQTIEDGVLVVFKFNFKRVFTPIK